MHRAVSGTGQSSVSLPVTVGAGVEYRLSPVVRIAATSSWRGWSSAAADLTATGTHVFDTFDSGLGLEIGRGRGGSPFPLRLGVRYATLAFSPTAEQPHELDVSGGTGLSLARDRAQLSAAVERAIRDGGGTAERAWQVTIGFQIRP
jgi:hypothetical protein